MSWTLDEMVYIWALVRNIVMFLGKTHNSQSASLLQGPVVQNPD